MGIQSIHVDWNKVMIYECGPAHDRRQFEIVLPQYKKLGVLVSGGIDSALLYHLLLKEIKEQGTDHTVRPLYITRKEGSSYYALPVIDHVQKLFDSTVLPARLGNTQLPEHEQVRSAVEQAYRLLHLEVVYVGTLVVRPEHMIGWFPVRADETAHFKTPFQHLEKSHVIDMFYQLGLVDLLSKTYSCIQEPHRCKECNGCKERAWGFAELQQVDPADF